MLSIPYNILIHFPFPGKGILILETQYFIQGQMLFMILRCIYRQEDIFLHMPHGHCAGDLCYCKFKNFFRPYIE